MKRTIALVSLAALAGCEDFAFWNDAQDTYDGITEATVGLGFVVGIEGPDSDLVDLDGTEFEDGTTGATLFLADATEVADLEKAPITNAEVWLSTGSGDVSVPHDSDGMYLLEPSQQAVYQDAGTWKFRVDYGGTWHNADVYLPRAPDVDVPEDHDAGAKMVLTMPTQADYDSILALVYDVQNGEVTWSNEPSDIGEVYDLAFGDNDVSSLTIPGTAFAEESYYVVGIAGMQNNDESDLKDFNTVLSTMVAGKMKMYPVFTAPFDTADWVP